MSINDLPAIVGTVLILAGLALVGISAWSRTEGSEKTTQAGALIIVVGAFLLALSIFVSHGKQDSGARTNHISKYTTVFCVLMLALCLAGNLAVITINLERRGSARVITILTIL